MNNQFVYPYPRLALVLIGMGILLFHLLFPIPHWAQLVFFVASILFSGIPHGSLDHLVHKRNSLLSGKRISNVLFLIYYHKFLFIYGILWIINPGISLVIFILISAYHFGELDWVWLMGRKNHLLAFISTLYGIYLLSNMFIFHLPQMKHVTESIKSLYSVKSLSLDVLYQYRTIYLAGTTFIIIFLLLTYLIQNQLPLRTYFFAFLQMGVLLTILLKLPILLGFGFYFSCWHSILTLLSLQKYLWGRQNRWKSCIRNGLSNSFIAVVFLGLTLLLVGSSLDENSLISLMFIGIAVLTAPHMLVISKMFNHLHNKKIETIGME